MGWTSSGLWILIVLLHLTLPTWQQTGKPKQTIAERLADSLEVKYILKSNLEFDRGRGAPVPHSHAILSIKNVGKYTIPGSGYSFLFCHENRLFPLTFNGRTRRYVGPYNSLFYLPEEYQLIYHKGCMYELVAKRTKPLKKNEVLEINFKFEPYIVSKVSVFPNYYVKDGKGNYALLKSTKNVKDFANGFDKIETLMRAPLDLVSIPPIFQDLYQKPRYQPPSEIQLMEKESITPEPRRIEYLSTTKFSVDKTTWKIHRGENAVLIYARQLSRVTGIQISTTPSTPNDKLIVLSIHKTLQIPAGFENEREYYNIRATANKIELKARFDTGLAMGLQTLIQLTNQAIRPMVISDSPKYPFRGLMVDIASTFYGVSTYRKLIRLMARNKFNKLTINLWNNLGFRLEIPGLTELTKIGGRQCIDDEEKKCIYIQYGSDKDGLGVGNGYFNGTEYQRFLRYAKLHGIEVIPSLNMGMDARAAIVSMKQYTDKITGNPLMPLIDENEKVPGFSLEYGDSSINPCLAGAVKFFEKIIVELKKYYQAARTPLRVQLDGSFDMGLLRHSNHCLPGVTEITPNILNGLKLNLTKELVEILVNHSVKFTGNDEMFTLAVPEQIGDELYDTNTAFSKRRYDNLHDPYVEVRDYADEKKGWKRSGNFLAAKFKVIVSPQQLTSLHMAEFVDPNKPGDSNARVRVIKPEQLHKLVPRGVCCNIHGGGYPFNCQPNEPDFNCTALSVLSNDIIGSQVHMDTTKVRDEKDFFELLGARLFFFGEQMWHGSDWQNAFTEPKRASHFHRNHNRTIEFFQYEPNSTEIDRDFDEKMYKFGSREWLWLWKNKYLADLPLPGAILENNTFYVSHQYPNFNVMLYNPLQASWQRIGSTELGAQVPYMDTTRDEIKFALRRDGFVKEYSYNTTIGRNDTMRGQVAAAIQERVTRMQKIHEANMAAVRERQQRLQRMIAQQQQQQQRALQAQRAQQGGTQTGTQAGLQGGGVAGQGGQGGRGVGGQGVQQGVQPQQPMPWGFPFGFPNPQMNQGLNGGQNNQINRGQSNQINRGQNNPRSRGQNNPRARNNNLNPPRGQPQRNINFNG